MRHFHNISEGTEKGKISLKFLKPIGKRFVKSSVVIASTFFSVQQFLLRNILEPLKSQKVESVQLKQSVTTKTFLRQARH